MALTKVSGEVITRPLVLTGNASVSGIMTVGTGSTTTTIDGSQDFPTIRPTLDLNFAATKTLDRRITFTRDSIGTYTDEFGIIQTVPNNVPRFDHDPVTGESLGLLIEESRTNLLPRSEEFDLWTGPIKNTGSVGVNSITSPDGTLTADKIIPGTNSTRHYLAQLMSITANTTYTASCFAKAGEYNFASVIFGKNGSPYTRGGSIVNLTTGEITDYDVNSPTNVIRHTPINYGNGWWKISVSVLFDSTSTDGYVEIGCSSLATNYAANSGDGVSGIYVWGAQLEAGSFPTSYIPTSGSTVTRSYDIAKITGTNFTDFYNQTEGTIFFRYKNLSLDTSTIRGVWGLENSSAAVSGVRSPQSGALRIRLLYNNNFSPAASNLFLISTDYQNGIVSYNQTENRLMMNGTSDFVSATHTNDNDIIAMSIGSRTTNGDSPLGGHISHLTYYNKRLTNAQLQSLTRQ